MRTKLAILTLTLSLAATFAVRTWRYRHRPDGHTPEEMWIEDELTWSRRTHDPTLNLRIDLFDAKGDNFSTVLDRFRAATGARVNVRWDKLTAAGITPDAPCTVRVHAARASRLLNTILDDIGGGTVKLSWTISHGVFEISTADDMNSRVISRIYPVQDIFDAIEADRVLHPPPTPRPLSYIRNPPPPTTDQQDLERLIREIVDPNAWRENGGQYATVRCVGGRLFVTATLDDIMTLHQLLQQLRQAYALRRRSR
jgi:hypothetical protein